MVRPCVARVFRRRGRCGLASMYPASDWSISCSAIMDIRHIRSHSRQVPGRPFVPPDHVATVRPFLHLAHLVKCMPPVVREGPTWLGQRPSSTALAHPGLIRDVRDINGAIAWAVMRYLLLGAADAHGSKKGSPAIRVTPRTPGTLRRLGMCSVAATGRPRRPGLARGKMGKVGNYGKTQNLR
jgi:hypothetical protein